MPKARKTTKNTANKVQNIKKENKAVVKNTATVSVINRTNQKQVLQLGEEQIVLKAYETKIIEGIDKVQAKVKFSQYTQKGVINLK